MPTITYYHSDVERGETEFPISWQFPDCALQEVVELPTTQIRVLRGSRQVRGEIVALGAKSLTFKLHPDSPDFQMFGAGAVLHTDYNNVIFGEPTRVRPSAAWIDRWCNVKYARPDVIQARRALFGAPTGMREEKWVEVRESYPDQQLAFLCAFHRFESDHYGSNTQDTAIDCPAKFDDLVVIYGSPLEERPSLAAYVECARAACVAREEESRPASSTRPR